jgi:hypothetical protein
MRTPSFAVCAKTGPSVRIGYAAPSTGHEYPEDLSLHRVLTRDLPLPARPAHGGGVLLRRDLHVR